MTQIGHIDNLECVNFQKISNISNFVSRSFYDFCFHLNLTVEIPLEYLTNTVSDQSNDASPYIGKLVLLRQNWYIYKN